MKTYQKLKDRYEYLRVNPEDEKFPGEQEDFKEVLGWLESFSKKLESSDAVSITHSLVQLNVGDPHHRVYDDDSEWTILTDRWFNVYHWQFNTTVWELITNYKGLIQKIRRVLLADLRVKHASFPGCGKIVMHAYSRAMLDYFLQPKGAAWCLTEDWKTPEVKKLALEIIHAGDKISA